jgi:hypothetical protein
MKRLCTLAVVTLLGVFASTSPALACEAAGPDAHVGVVTAVDHTRNTLTLRDAETGKRLTFVAGGDLLRGITAKDTVTVRFAPEGEVLRAVSIAKVNK